MNNSEEMIKALGELIAIKSVTRKDISEKAPLGEGSRLALEKALEICQDLGFRTKNCSNMTGWAEIGQGEEMIGVLCHLDVVPASDSWSTEPFKLTRKDGRLYGRGTVDDKGPAVQCIFAMKGLLDKKAYLKRRIRIIFGLTEEAGSWDDMEYYKANEEMPVFGITPDADFPVICGEKGILNLELSMELEKSRILSAKAGNAINVVPDKCEISYKDKNGDIKTARAEGTASHASLPEQGINAISECIDKIKEDTDSPLVSFYKDNIKKEIYGESMGCALEDDKSGKLTLNAGILKVEDQKLILSLDIRIPIDYSDIDVIGVIEKRAAAYGISVKKTAWKAPVYMDRNGKVIEALLDTYIEMTGDVNAQAKTMGGGTYARAMENIAAFGAAFPGHENREHMDDEYVLEEDMLLGRQIYEKALERLANI